MANPTRFVSVNLNKSYGKQPARSSSSTSSAAPPSYANGGIGSRARFTGTSGGGGRGMVLLSRARGAAPPGQKGGAKLSVPAPLNLPSLRKEHERFDPTTASGVAPGPGASALGSGHGSSAMGWSKPAVVDRDPAGIGERGPPLAAQCAASAGSATVPGASGRAVFLRGEDFPSLKATISVVQKQKDPTGPKQRVAAQQHPEERVERPSSEPTLAMRPHARNSRYAEFKEPNEDESVARGKGGTEKMQMLDGFLSGPIPLIQFKHTSDWADDERDTSHGILDRGRARGVSRTESAKGYDYLDMGSALERDFGRVDSFDRDAHAPGRSTNSWRSPLPSREGSSGRESVLDRDGYVARFSSHNRDINKDSIKHGQSMHGGSSADGARQGHVEHHHSWRSLGHGQNTQTARNNVDMLDARHAEQSEHDWQLDASSNRYRGDSFSKNNSSKQLLIRGIPSDNLGFKFGRDNNGLSSNGKVSSENMSLQSRDLFSAGMPVDSNSKLLRRKKDTSKRVDFYDPVRESFEAELERVQKLQEEERQRALEEHARVLELARKEEEERERRVREEEERRRRLEEEAREAAWRAEQDRLATAKRAEEQRLAREEEKRRMLAEEERRKEAARQKLLELEAKIAKRQAEDASKDNQVHAPSDGYQVTELKDRDGSKIPDKYWEEGERVVQHVTNSAVSEPSVSSRFIVPGPNFPLPMDGNPSYIEKGKLLNSWKCEVYGDHVNLSAFPQRENELQTIKQDAFGSGRVIPRKGFLGGPRSIHLRPSSKGALMDSTHMLDDHHISKGQKWNNFGEGDRYNRSAFIDHDLDSRKYDLGWDQSRLRGSPQVRYAQNITPRSEIDGFSNPLRSRYSLRQPHVYPPPSITSVNKGFVKDDPDQTSVSVFERENTYQTVGTRHENQAFESEDHHEQSEHPGISSSKENAIVLQNEKTASRCGSQSSLSVSNPPTSPTHLSHEDFDGSADFPSLPASADGRPLAFSDGEHSIAIPELGKTNLTTVLRSLPFGEEEEWSIGNNGEMLDQEDYDEDDIYHEEGEHHEEDEDIVHTGEDFDMSTVVQNVDAEMAHDQKVLGFNDGVEVIIPNDDFDETSLDAGNNVDAEVAPKDATVRLGSCDGAISNGDNLDLETAFPVEVGSTAKLLNDTEKAFYGLVIEVETSTSVAMKDSEMSPITSDQTFSAPAFDLPDLSPLLGQPASSSASAVHSQVEAATKLQFGLFSGPSLTPSPIPAIQIGSIRMPLNITSPIGPPLVHPLQPPFFQFGQLRYSSPISQGILPISSQSIPYTPSPIRSVHFSSHQNFARSYGDNGILGSPTQNVLSLSVLNESNYGKKCAEDPNKPEFPQLSAPRANQLKVALSSHDLAKCFPSEGNQITSESDTSMKIPENRVDASKGYSISMDDKNNHQAEPPTVNKSSLFLSGDKSFSRYSRASGSIMAGRGKRYIYTVKNRGPRQQFSGLDIPRAEFGFHRKIRRGIRRTEFRVRENYHKRFDTSDASAYIGQDDKISGSGNSFVPSSKSGSKRDITYSKPSKMTIESEGLNMASRNVQTAKFDERKESGKEFLTNMFVSSTIHSQFKDGNLKRSATIEEDVDSPLQSGVVRIFKQPGIEAPSDEDDFIEVRSKRQMLHDRREQREKEIKAKYKESKAPRKPRPVYQANTVSSKPGKVVSGDVSKGISTSFPMELAGFATGGQSTTFSASTVSQPLAPIGTPTVIADNDMRSLNKKSGETSTAKVISSGVITDLVGGSCLEKVTPFEIVTPLTSWSDVHLNQQVMALTQTQLEEAMKPEHFDTYGALIDEHGAMANAQEKSASNATQEKSFSASGSPLSSLLAGERIQFGAVTTPFIPSVSRAFSNGIGCHALDSCKTESFGNRLTPSEIDHTLFFDEGKHHSDSCIHLEDSEAEAAASAVAVAAISSDDVVNNGLNTTSVSISDSEKFGSADACGLTSHGVRSNGEVRNLSTGEESLPVTLPADLSVETQGPLWPVLPNPQSTSNTMFSHCPGPPPSQFPCFEMNPMLRGPIFTFSPQNESGSTQSQPQRSTTLGPGSLGAWPHSGVDSFYGPPAGFAGHFISPPAGMPAVQAPPQMVFYNHFPTLAPFGVGIMGTTFISSGKQPDWKHNPSSSSKNVNEGDNENLTTCSPQLIPPSMPPSLQHLSPASPLVPMGSHLPMFDLSPFQPAVDVPVQARWPHMPPAPLHGMPFSPLLHTQVDGGMPLDISQKMAKLPTGNSNLPETRPSVEADAKFTFASDSAAPFRDELGLLDAPISAASPASGDRPSYSPVRGNNNDDKGPNGSKNFARSSVGSSRASIGSASNSSNSVSSNGISHSAPKPQLTPQQTTSSQQHHLTGYSDKRGAPPSQKTTSGGEWHRRASYQGRSHTPSGSERNFPSRMKQIYVAKSPASGTANTG